MMFNLNENDFIDNSIYWNSLNWETIRRYCREQIYCDVQEKISKYLNIDKEKILLSNWAYHWLRIVSNVLMKDNDNIIIPCPNYPFYYDISKEIIKILYNKDWTLDIQNAIDSINNKTKVIYLSNPNNPLWVIHPYSEIKYILDNISNDIYLLLDEAYIEYSESFSSVELLSKYTNMIIIRTFSKAFWQAWSKLWYILSNGELKNKFEKERGKFYSLSNISLQLANKTLSNIEYVKETIKESNLEKEKIYKEKDSENISYLQGYWNFICLERSEKNNNYKDNLSNLSQYPDIWIFGNYDRLSISKKI